MRTEERRRYLLHARLPVHRRRVEQARQIVREALARCPGTWAVGCSGGKDSVALAALAVEAGWRGPLFHFRYQETPPENTALVYELGVRLGLPVDEIEVPGAFEVFDRFGFFTSPETAGQRRAVREMERGYKETAESFAAERYVGLFWGLRAEESKPRAIVVARHGTLYKAASRQTWTALPLARWSADDVWAWIIARDLPWLGRYDAARDRGRMRSEETWLSAPTVWSKGAMGQELRRRDPARWQELCARFPALRREG